MSDTDHDRVQIVFDMMKQFPVLAGRVTETHAEWIVKALDEADSKRVIPIRTGVDIDHTAEERIALGRAEITRELGYLSAAGHKIRAVKIYRAVYGVGLLAAKDAIETAAAEARKLYHFG